MAKDKETPKNNNQKWVAISVLGFSGLVLIALGITAISADTSQAINIFNVILPVVASWVGTVLAYYFGRENFESANQQVREMVQRLSPDQLAKSPVTSIMRSFNDTVHLKIPEGQDDKDILLSTVMEKFDGRNITRIPIVVEGNKPKYMIHESRINKYIAEGGSKDDSLEKFIAHQKDASIEFGIFKGFVVVSEKTTIADAKQKMEEISACQDIFISKQGTADEALTGWISNLRLGKYLEA